MRQERNVRRCSLGAAAAGQRCGARVPPADPLGPGCRGGAQRASPLGAAPRIIAPLPLQDPRRHFARCRRLRHDAACSVQRWRAACLICRLLRRCRSMPDTDSRQGAERGASAAARRTAPCTLMLLSAQVLTKAPGQRSRSKPPVCAEQRGCRRVLLRANLALTTRPDAPALRRATAPGLLPPVECRSEGTAPAG
ncbi:hypothetical protein FA09DRAFT_91804 [Tilletiopsis washingtonensis]|jgi:hypothetical protein|uniref:Uncharacterized protein n=1 Tax=Tilletiopsis washingtonensis TaxID=58919 RepID=A0A316Z631_9BASI|nr:hypothetical protein FA09DRAFT_91804 [Tilletiopsis washingtonensis]PWN96514.1 hypothetical protein FA09DRAFT_91804 [Tilletiopsis washingtonensis]